MPDETPVDLAAHLAKLARDARDRLPSIVARIEEIVRAVDPIELLSQLSILNLTHPAGVMPDRDDKAKWQIRIEWLAWLVLARKLEEPASPQVIDSRVLTPLEGALDDYFNAVTLSLHVPVDGLTADEDSLRASLQLEALVVRGLGFQKDLQALSEDLYSPHDDWCLANVGLTVRDAFSVAKAVGALYTAKVSKLRRDAAAVEATVRENPARAAELEEIPPTIRDALRDGGTPATDAEQFAHAIRGLWFYSQSATLVSFAPDDVHSQLGGAVPVERIVAFFNLLSASAETVTGEPNPVALSPLAFAPFVRRRNRFFLFVAPLLYEGIFFAFHRRLYADETYRSRYDKTRSDWLEVAALDALRGVLPDAKWGWSLKYGPRRERTELDGLALDDGRLLITRCAGMDVHQASVVVTVRVPDDDGGRRTVTETFGTMTPDLLALRAWLQAYGVTHVAIESTGVYWKPVYYVLEEGFTLLLINMHDLKRVPGRKTDVKDSEWLAQWLECGLLKSSFVPPPPIRELRDLTRYRVQQVRDQAQDTNRLCKVLEDAGVKLTTVVSDVMGVSGRAMLAALINGTTDPAVLADLAHGRCGANCPRSSAHCRDGFGPIMPF